MTCNLCSYRELTNEARDEGADVWLAEQEPYGFNMFVIPKDTKPDLRLHRDETYGPQRKAWFNEIPETCECGEHVKVKHPPSIWKPDESALTPEPPEPEHSLELPEPPDEVVPLELAARTGSITPKPPKRVALSLL
jgi:hypothetical protein